MKTFLYDEEQRRMWVRHKHNKTRSVQQICREAAISRATLYNWISEFPEEAARARERRGPEQKDDRLEVVKKLSEQASEPDGAAKFRMLLSAIHAVDGDKAFARRLVPVLVKRFTLTVAQACALVGMEESAYGYRPRKPEANDQDVYDELVRLITEEPSRGFTECYQLLQRSHPAWPRKQIRRVYKEKRIFLLRKRTRKVPARNAGDGATPAQEIAVVRRQRPGAAWSLGLVEGRMPSGDSFWLSYIMDTADNAVLNAAAGAGHATREDLLDFLSLAAMENGQPKKLRIPGREPFTGRELTRWTWDQRAALITLTPNKPENQEELQAMDERVRQAIAAGGAADVPALQDWIETWTGE